jgi:hypothetical protein
MRWTELLWMVAAVPLFLPVVSVMASSIQGLALQLFEQSGDAEHEGERAAFVVLGPGGRLELIPWPAPPRNIRSVNWTGAMPAGVVAVMHTHPSTVPRPSGQDLAEARRLSLPFYVVSRTSLCVAASDGGVRCSPLPAPESSEAAPGGGRPGLH